MERIKNKMSFTDILTGMTTREKYLDVIPEGSPEGDLYTLAISNICPVNVLEQEGISKNEILKNALLLNYDNTGSFIIEVPSRTYNLTGLENTEEPAVPPLDEEKVKLLVVELDSSTLKEETQYSREPYTTATDELPVFAVFGFIEMDKSIRPRNVYIAKREYEDKELTPLECLKEIDELIQEEVTPLTYDENCSMLEKAHIRIINNNIGSLRSHLFSIIYDESDAVSILKAAMYSYAIGSNLYYLTLAGKDVNTEYVLDFTDKDHYEEYGEKLIVVDMKEVDRLSEKAFNSKPNEVYKFFADIIAAASNPDVGLDSRVLTLKRFMDAAHTEDELLSNISNLFGLANKIGVGGVFESVDSLFSNTFRPYSIEAADFVEAVHTVIKNEIDVDYLLKSNRPYIRTRINDLDVVKAVYKELRTSGELGKIIDDGLVLLNTRVDENNRDIVFDVEVMVSEKDLGKEDTDKTAREIVFEAIESEWYIPSISLSYLFDLGIGRFNKETDVLYTATMNLDVDKLLKDSIGQ